MLLLIFSISHHKVARFCTFHDFFYNLFRITKCQEIVINICRKTIVQPSKVVVRIDMTL